MSVTIYHNPACGTSRNTLAMIRQSGEEPEVIEYLKTPPSRARLVELITALGISARELLREKGTPYAELGLADPKWSDDELIGFMLDHPILINRPAVPWLVGLYITAAYWFTASTSFANPAVAIARSLTNTFSGIRPIDLPGFIASEFCGAGDEFVVLVNTAEAATPAGTYRGTHAAGSRLIVRGGGPGQPVFLEIRNVQPAETIVLLSAS